jgi:hypothetical protein
MQFVACDNTIATPELIHLILLSLPMRELLTTAPRVCKSWKGIIDGSAVIQRKLYFRDIAPRASRTPSRNPLLAEFFTSWFRDGEGVEEDSDYFNRDSLERFPFAKNKAAFLRKGATWRRMLVQQPAVTTVGHLHTARDCGDTLCRCWAVFDCEEGGLRMGSFYDLIMGGMAVHRLWRRVVWSCNNVEDRFARPSLEDMLEEASVVVYSMGPSVSRKGPSAGTLKWAETFRCEESTSAHFVADRIDAGHLC